MDFRRKKKRIGDLLVEAKLLTATQRDEAIASKPQGKLLGEYLVEIGRITEEQLAEALSNQLGYELVDLSNVSVDDKAVDIFKDNSKLLKDKRMLPYGFTSNGSILLAMADPLDMDAQDDVALVSNCRVEVRVATARGILLEFEKHFGRNEVANALDQYAKEKNLGQTVDEEAEAEVNSSPIVAMVRDMIENAVRQRASDIHVEPMDSCLRVRYRIDGELYERGRYNINVQNAVSARIKIIGGMDISEKRKPQDGRITQFVDRVEYDIRVSVLPTVYGEKIVMRLAAKMALTRNKSQLGLSEKETAVFDNILAHPNGIVLVTGPTGSGKSTTLYTALSELNREGVNIVTVEDPVEANIDGINQIHVNPKANLTFASALRSILRQDPDIIMIGEIRDEETARIAVQASITGHLVVSTLHTNSTASTVTRLEDMGIEPYLISDSVIGIIAQRLVRRLCPECKVEKEATAEEKQYMDVPVDQPCRIYEHKGCPKCDGTGYKGRIGVYEIMPMTYELKRIIATKGGADAIKETALKQGMSTLHMSATQYVLQGITEYSEMARISFDS
ncbi:MAG: Flp pilus assembly complex ATPase component TadA [Lachnospiraceae bacterium]|nr:Flp pilus assembly complex ATPase component TadA [Candidatus Merdinaster equi]